MKQRIDTRTILALFWSVFAAWVLGYAVVKHGEDKGILNLIIGTISGLIAGILGTYFSMSSHKEQKPQEGTVTADISLTSAPASTSTQPASGEEERGGSEQ